MQSATLTHTAWGPARHTTTLRRSQLRPPIRAAGVRCQAVESPTKAPGSAAQGVQGGNTNGAGAAPMAALPADSNAAVPRPPQIPAEDVILMEGFGWDSCKNGHWYKVVESKLEELKAAGITHLWLPPPSQSVAPQGYLPGQLYNLKSSYGTKEELVSLNRKLMEAGIRPVADIVINHRCADYQDEHGVWNKYGDDITHDGKPIDWGRWAITSDDPVFRGKGNKDSGDDFHAAPDLDHHNKELRDSLVDWLNWLAQEIGFMGWRFDFIRGYASKYAQEYTERTLGADAFYVGEDFSDLVWHDAHLDYNQDPARQKNVDYIEVARNITQFDFVTKGILQEAVKNCEYDRLRDGRGKAPGLLGWWPARTTTFVENHDTGSSQQHWPFPDSHVMLGYAYILTHPGVPCLFWEHHFDWKLGPEIDKLTAARRAAGVRADSKLEILAAEKDMYVARTIGARGGALTLKLGPRYDMGDLVPNKAEGWRKVASGQDFAVWLKPAADEEGAEQGCA